MAQTLITDRRTPGSSYKILRRLGKGGMAEVFLARQEGMAGLRRLTVIKKILPQLSEVQDVAEMLLDEARIAAQLTHPNIVQIYELGQEEGQYFIAMEFVDGCDLATLARIERHRHSRIPLRLTLRVMSEAAMALDYAHRQVSLDGRPLNLVHRDVSPHNVLCSRDGAVKVTDFGISKFAGKHQLTQVGVVKGKVQYMSPEQYRGAAVDHRSDIFSMGVVLYQLTVGKLPRVTDSGEVAIKRVVEGTIPRPTSLRSEYPEELEDIVMRALANNPEERYPDAAALRDDLLDFAREHDLLAFPKELGEYVNTLVPATNLVVQEKSVMSCPSPSASPPEDGDSGDQEPLPRVEDGRPLPLVIVEELQSEAAPHTEVASSIGRHRKASPARMPPEEAERNTEIPITDSAIEDSYEDSELAVLPDEDLTPFPDDMDSDPFQEPTPPPRYRARQDRAARLPPPQKPAATDRIRVRQDPALAETVPEPVVPREPPPAQTVTQPRVERSGAGVGAWVVIAVVAVLVASGSLIYVFFGDRIGTTPRPTSRPVNKPKLGAGVIHIHSNPSESSVSIDGAKRCFSTPCRVAGLPLGRELLLSLRSEGHSLWMQRVVLTPHQPKLLLRADLTPLPGYKKKPPPPKTRPGSAAKKVSGSAPTPRKKTGGARPPTARKKTGAVPGKRKPAGGSAPGAPRGKKKGNMTIIASGSDAAVLAVDVRPWAEVWVDGQRIGFTPLVRQMPLGKHKLVLKNADLKYEKSFSIHAKKGKKVKISDVIAPPSQ